MSQANRSPEEEPSHQAEGFKSEKYFLERLFRELEGKPVTDFISQLSFQNPLDYRQQTPFIYPLGKLHFVGAEKSRGIGDSWATEDGSVFVIINSDGIIEFVFEVQR